MLGGNFATVKCNALQKAHHPLQKRLWGRFARTVHAFVYNASCMCFSCNIETKMSEQRRDSENTCLTQLQAVAQKQKAGFLFAFVDACYHAEVTKAPATAKKKT